MFFGGRGKKGKSKGGRSGGESKVDKNELIHKTMRDLDNTIRTLEMKVDDTNDKVEQCIIRAKKFSMKGNKRRALNELKRKRVYEAQAAKFEGMITRIEEQKSTIEMANINMNVLKTMQQSNNVLKEIHSGMDTDKIQDLMDEMEDQKEVFEEISSLLGGELEGLEDSELEAELEGLMEEDLEEQLDGIGKDKELKTLDKQEVSEESESEEYESEQDDLKQLEGALGF